MTRLTLYGFYKWRPSILDGAQLPDALDRETLIRCIFDMSGDLYTYIQNPESLEDSVHRWFARKKDSFARMAAALAAEYNPIENYERLEETSDTTNVNVSGETHNTSAGTSSTNATSNDASETVNAVSAYNSSAFQPDNKTNTTATGESGESGENHLASDGTSSDTSHSEYLHSSRIHGNIGVTTSQQMLQAELELRMYDLYEVVAKEFEDYFLIRIF